MIIKNYFISHIIFALIGVICITVITYLDVRNPLIITLAFIPYSIGTIIPNVILYPICLNLIPHAKGRVSALGKGAHLALTAVCLEFTGYYYHESFRNIGIIITCIIIIAIITLFFVLKNYESIKYSKE